MNEDTKQIHPFLAEICDVLIERGVIRTQQQFGKELCLSHAPSLYLDQPSYRLLCCLMVRLRDKTHHDLSQRVYHFIEKAVWLEREI